VSRLDRSRAAFEAAWSRTRGQLDREVGRSPRGGRWAVLLVAGAVGLALALGVGRKRRLRADNR
jgi:hypothetical protein